MKKNKGYFLTIEGCEGAGKSTLVASLAEYLRSIEKTVLTTHEPGGTALGEKIRTLLLKQQNELIVPSAELLLILAARAQHIETVIKPELEKGNWVICDRFHDSTIAYQGGGRGLGVDYVSELCLKTTQFFQPDFTILIDIDIEEGLKRSKRLLKPFAAEGEGDRFENEELAFHQRVSETFRNLQKTYPGRIFPINGALSRQEVFLKAKEFCANLVNNHV